MTPTDPKADRYRPVEIGLQVGTTLIASLAVLSIVLAGRAADGVATATIVLLVTAPLVRVTWLAQRWFRRGDIRYGLVAAGVLLIVIGGAIIAR